MARPISEYIASDEFRDKMRNVSAKSRPYGNSTPSDKVYEALAQAARERQGKLGGK